MNRVAVAALVALLPGLAHASLPVLPVVRGPDFDGDGYDDLAVGSREQLEPEYESQMHMLWGSATGLSTPPQLPSTIVDSELPGDPASNGAGFRFAWGDFDGDCIDDLVLADPCDSGFFFEEDVDCNGEVYVLSGDASGPSASSPLEMSDAMFGFEADRFGVGLAVGDFNGDLFDDLAMGSRAHIDGIWKAGAVAIVYGSPDGLDPAAPRGWQVLHRGLPGMPEPPGYNDSFGMVLAAGDFDCDGDDDLAAGGHDSVDVIYGSAGGLHPFAGPGAEVFFPADLGLPPEQSLRALASGNFDGMFATWQPGDIGLHACMDLAVGAESFGRGATLAVIYGLPSDAPDPGLQLGVVPPDAFVGPDGFGHSLSIGRFDDDAIHDLAVAHDLGTLVMTGSPTGLIELDSLDVPANGSYSSSPRLAVGYGDFASDGNAELVVGNRLNDSLNCSTELCFEGEFQVVEMSGSPLVIDTLEVWTAADLPGEAPADHEHLGMSVTSARSVFRPGCFDPSISPAP